MNFLEIPACSCGSNPITVTRYWWAGWHALRGGRGGRDPAQFDICLFDSHFKGDLENPIAGDLYPLPSSKGFRDTLTRLGSAPQRQ